MKTLLRFFFRLLYHQFAFTYDLVAAVVSFNRWKQWVLSVLPLVEGSRVLEMGHGPGHLQRLLLNRGLLAFGIDESAQMGRLAKRNLRRSPPAKEPLPRGADYTQARFVRGIVQSMPFATSCFDTIVATFPTEYIYDPQTLAEAKRCLVNGGRLVVLPVALPRNRLLDWLFKVTHQRPAEALEVMRARLAEPFLQAGFQTDLQALDVSSGTLLIVLARKTAA